MNNISTNIIKNPIMEIQLYLRGIARCKPEIPLVYIDGTYDENTERAVKIFQQIYGIPATGKVDLTTWEALVNEYQLCTIRTGEVDPNKVSFFPNNNYIVKLGDKNDVVYIIQILLNNIGKQYKRDEIKVTGTYDAKTEEAIKMFQKTNKLEITGIVDVETWNALTHINNTCRLYELS